MLWKPDKEWDGQDAYLIGGGASLRGFDFRRLEGRNTIGCNDAFRYGPSIIKYTLFGDASWWHKNKFALEKAGMPIITCAPSLQTLNAPWLRIMKRQKVGLHEGHLLGWNYSTGGSAINLALTLGAKRIYLLGFDVCLVDGKSHWHDGLRTGLTRDSVFERFIRGFKCIAEHLELPQWDAEVFHVIDGESKLPWFTKMTHLEFSDHLNGVAQPREAVAA